MSEETGDSGDYDVIVMGGGPPRGNVAGPFLVDTAWAISEARAPAGG